MQGIRLVLASLLIAAGCARGPREAEGNWPVMGTVLRVHVWGADTAATNRALRAAHDEVALVDNLMSTYQANSEISAVNRRAGTDSITYVSPSMTSVLAAALEYARKTEGALDVTVGALVHVWGFHEHKGRVPSLAQIDSTRRLTGSQRVVFNESARTVRLPQRGMQLDFGAIAKGFALDRAARAMRAAGASAGTVDLGGNVLMFGPAPQGSWSVGIRDPRNSDALIGTLRLDSGAVSTSGDYEQYFEQGGRRYSHIFDPRTGRPVEGVAAATVIADTGMASDALSTALFVLGPGKGCAVAAREQVAALWITAGPGNARDLRLTTTARMDSLLQLTDSLPRARCPG